MDQHRGRSPSASHANASNTQARSPSAQAAFNQQASARGVDPTFSQSNSFADSPTNPQTTFSDSSFLSTDQFSSDQSQTAFLPGSNHIDSHQQYSGGFDFQDTSGAQPFDSQAAFDSSDVDPGLLQSGHGNGDQSFDDFFFDTSAQVPQQQLDVSQTIGGFDNTQPAMAHPQMLSNNNTNINGTMSFPSDNAHYIQQFQQPHTSHSRHTSLSPSSALTNEWSGMSFNGHRRNPSDALSDVSSTAQPSPFVDALDHPEHLNNASPLFNTSVDQALPETLGQFSLSENQFRVSPAHSSHGSPHLSPQSQNLVQFQDGNDNFGMLGPDGQFGGDSGPQMYTNLPQGAETFPGMAFHADQGNGNATNMETPEISIEFAPDRQGTMSEMRHASDGDTLIPPSRSPNRQRGRAISDPYSPGSMSGSNSANRSRAPSLGLPSSHGHARNFSRSNSPSGPVNGIQKSRDRAASTSSIEHRREPSPGLGDLNAQTETSLLSSSPGSNASDYSGANKRTQKHPATFKCPQCPKKFTRAYNLRSHLRTHTDERPFVCTVCGKAFARQHDRKRHEGLHSGEKKFVCRGLLAGATDGTWGCGRRFARADALGRHFRSEAGRTCIKPLLDEEARERRAAQIEQANQDMLNAHPDMQGQPQQMGMPDMADGPIDVSGITLPAALLAQYPALAGIQWDAIPAGGSGGQLDEGELDFEHSGRSSFEASSGGELDFDEDGLDAGFGGQAGEWSQSQMMGQASGGQEWR